MTTDRPATAAIVPAAGRSGRMGQPKLLLTIGRQTLLARVIGALRGGGVDRVIVVAPPAESDEGPTIFTEAEAAGAEVIVPQERPAEMRDSIELAVKRLADGPLPTWVLLTPADCPAITPELVGALLDHAASQPANVIIPVAHKKRGHPIVLPWDLAARIPAMPEGVGVNVLVSEASSRLTELPVTNPDVCADLDTPADLKRWLERESSGTEARGDAVTNGPLASGQSRERPGDLAASTARITLEIRLFAMAKERAGLPAVAIELPVGASVADLRAEIGRRLPALAPLVPRTMIAVDEEYAPDDQILRAGARIAMIPPVSGG